MSAAFPWRLSTVFTMSRGRGASIGGHSVGVARLPGDSVGTTTVTLTNLVVGSAIRIEVASTGALVTSRTATLSSEAFSLDYYASGDPANDLRIKVRKASAAPLYKPYETQATLGAAQQSIFIAQQLD